jgi:hypothetical protein
MVTDPSRRVLVISTCSVYMMNPRMNFTPSARVILPARQEDPASARMILVNVRNPTLRI